MRTTTIGIDPGRHGGIAFYRDGSIIEAFPLPFLGDELLIGELSRDILGYSAGTIRRACIEKVGAMPGQGVCSMFTFGKTVGELRGMLKTLGIAIIEPTPAAWKKLVLAGTDRDKTAAIEYVTRRYPDVDLKPGKLRKAHDGIADAVCLAEYGSRQ